MRNHSYENDFDLHENETAGRTHFHMKGFALRLVLKQRHKRTRKWPIARENSKSTNSQSESLHRSQMGYVFPVQSRASLVRGINFSTCCKHFVRLSGYDLSRWLQFSCLITSACLCPVFVPFNQPKTKTGNWGFTIDVGEMKVRGEIKTYENKGR